MTSENLDLIKEILPRLSASRADAYEDWLAVGMALFHGGADCAVWDEWSRQSPKYKAGACEAKWKTFASAGSTLGMGSLVEWARADGFDPYAGQAYDWGDVIVLAGDTAPKIAAIFGNTDLIRYLKAVFKDGENVNYVVDAYEREGKWLPASKGVTRNVAELVGDLQKYEDITYALGDYKKEAGAWIRFNPVKDGGGSKNEDVLDLRHCLVESDGMDIEAQLATIRRLRLPCAAIVNSGGKSVHAIVKIDAGEDLKLYKERVAYLFGALEREKFIVDKACKNPSRLSRLPGVTRGGRKQFLISTNEGCASWADWEAEIKANDFDFTKLTFEDLINTPPEDKSDNLLGDRFLTREGSWLIVAQSGVGKSVLAMQMAVLFALGRDLWGLKPVKPLKVAIIQAENNKLDLVEPLRSICENLELTKADEKILQGNFSVYPNSSECGKNFGRLLERVAKDLHPDIVIVDPLLSYIGGDISKQDVCSAFLRNTVHPIIQRYQMGLIIMHHTGKPRGKDEEASGNALSYAGTGSSELTNYVRAASTIFQNKDNEKVYDFTYSKRGKRAECNPTIYLKQGENGAIFWDKADKPDAPIDVKKRRPSKYDGQGWESLPPCDYDALIAQIKDICGGALGEDITDKKADNIRRVLLDNGKLILDRDTKKYQGALSW